MATKGRRSLYQKYLDKIATMIEGTGVRFTCVNEEAATRLRGAIYHHFTSDDISIKQSGNVIEVRRRKPPVAEMEDLVG